MSRKHAARPAVHHGPPEREHAVQLAGGRRLGVAEFGATTGRPVFWFHGTPGARLIRDPKGGHLAGLGMAAEALEFVLSHWDGDE